MLKASVSTSAARARALRVNPSTHPLQHAWQLGAARLELEQIDLGPAIDPASRRSSHLLYRLVHGVEHVVEDEPRAAG